MLAILEPPRSDHHTNTRTDSGHNVVKHRFTAPSVVNPRSTIKNLYLLPPRRTKQLTFGRTSDGGGPFWPRRSKTICPVFLKCRRGHPGHSNFYQEPNCHESLTRLNTRTRMTNILWMWNRHRSVVFVVSNLRNYSSNRRVVLFVFFFQTMDRWFLTFGGRLAPGKK